MRTRLIRRRAVTNRYRVSSLSYVQAIKIDILYTISDGNRANDLSPIYNNEEIKPVEVFALNLFQQTSIAVIKKL